MHRTLKVAFATSDMKHVDQHFGAAESFVLYALDQKHANLTEAVQFGQQHMDGNEDKLGSKIRALRGCLAVYCQAIGASAIHQLQAKRIQAIKVTPGSPIKELIHSLQAELRTGPSPWLARAIEQQEPRDSTHFDTMEQEGWSE